MQDIHDREDYDISEDDYNYDGDADDVLLLFQDGSGFN
jgi:hypothetical protein